MSYLQKEVSKQKEAFWKYFSKNKQKKRKKTKQAFIDKYVNFAQEAQNKSIDNK